MFPGTTQVVENQTEMKDRYVRRLASYFWSAPGLPALVD